MTIRRLTMAILAVVFGAFSSVAMLQSARPAMAAQTWHHAGHQQRVADRDDRRRHDRKHHKIAQHNGRHVGWNNPRNPHYNGVKPKHQPVRDHDRH
jgi:Ni/Co efflux regulator RcnB